MSQFSLRYLKTGQFNLSFRFWLNTGLKGLVFRSLLESQTIFSGIHNLNQTQKSTTVISWILDWQKCWSENQTKNVCITVQNVYSNDLPNHVVRPFENWTKKCHKSQMFRFPVFSIQITTPFICFLYLGVQYSDLHSTVFHFFYFNFHW